MSNVAVICCLIFSFSFLFFHLFHSTTNEPFIHALSGEEEKGTASSLLYTKCSSICCSSVPRQRYRFFFFSLSFYERGLGGIREEKKNEGILATVSPFACPPTNQQAHTHAVPLPSFPWRHTLALSHSIYTYTDTAAYIATPSSSSAHIKPWAWAWRDPEENQNKEEEEEKWVTAPHDLRSLHHSRQINPVRERNETKPDPIISFFPHSFISFILFARVPPPSFPCSPPLNLTPPSPRLLTVSLFALACLLACFLTPLPVHTKRNKKS